ncbi:MAG: coproporphyrinogen-III oxidase family protein [Eubacteriales bacterium]|nr:coproporphyrinogen-III oxidase family protein [Eubacteriales bacterium]
MTFENCSEKKEGETVEIYIHIPVCARKCAYCDFLSFPMGRAVQEAYKNALLSEIRSRSDWMISKSTEPEDREVSSVFIGGGTPSIFPAEWIEEILDEVRRFFHIITDAEISIEANPGTVKKRDLEIYRRAGINRISFGCQSADDRELRLLGRIHTWERFLESYTWAREAGFSNINVDLMSALPGQTVESWERSLRSVAELGAEHISAYSLIIEEGTPFYEMYAEADEARRLDTASAGRQPQESTSDDGQIPERDAENGTAERQNGSYGDAAALLPDEESERLMYERTETILAEYGYHRYEISNYTKDGRECRHNVGYWTGIPYLGMGLGASSYDGAARFRNTDELTDYLNGDFEPKEIEYLDTEDLQAECMILGLRMTAGVSEREFADRFGKSTEAVYGPVIRKYEQAGLLERREGRIMLTREGLSLSNTVMADFLP